MKSRFRLFLVILGLMAGALLPLAGSTTSFAASIDNTPDCDNVSVIKCGAFSVAGMRQKAAENDVPKIYNAMGISQNDLKGTFVDGVVWKDGRVTIGDKTVATGARTAGRNYGGTPISGTNAGIYSTNKFVTDGQTAFVHMDGDKFGFAVVKACGNPVTATPVPTPKPQPTYTCDNLTPAQISRTDYKFTAKASAANGAQIVRYEFNFGDGKTASSTDTTVSHSYTAPGTYTVRLTAIVAVNGKNVEATGADCVTQVIVAQPPQPGNVQVCNQNTGQTITVKETEASSYKPVGDSACQPKPPAALPSTGPEAALGGLLGTGALSYGGYSYFQSRRHMIRKLLGR